MIHMYERLDDKFPESLYTESKRDVLLHGDTYQRLEEMFLSLLI